MGGKKLLPENSVKKLISWKNKQIFTEIVFFFFFFFFLFCFVFFVFFFLFLKDKTHFHMIKGIINAFDHIELCLVINLTLVVTGLLNDHQCLLLGILVLLLPFK